MRVPVTSVLFNYRRLAIEGQRIRCAPVKKTLSKWKRRRALRALDERELAKAEETLRLLAGKRRVFREAIAKGVSSRKGSLAKMRLANRGARGHQRDLKQRVLNP